MIKRKYPNQFLLGPYQLWTYPIPYSGSHSQGEIKRRVIVIFDRGYDLDELNDDYELPSTFCPYFAFFTSNELSKSIKPNIYIDYPYTQYFHLNHSSTLNIRDSFLSFDDNNITVEAIEKNGTFIGELNEKAIKILLSYSDDIEKYINYKLLTMNEFKEIKAQDKKWISENVIDKTNINLSSPVDNQDMNESLFNYKISKVDKIDNLLEDIYNLRQEGMKEENGEYSIPNLIFKEFRNLGYLDNLKELRKKYVSKELTLESKKTKE